MEEEYGQKLSKSTQVISLYPRPFKFHFIFCFFPGEQIDILVGETTKNSHTFFFFYLCEDLHIHDTRPTF